MGAVAGLTWQPLPGLAFGAPAGALELVAAGLLVVVAGGVVEHALRATVAATVAVAISASLAIVLVFIGVFLPLVRVLLAAGFPGATSGWAVSVTPLRRNRFGRVVFRFHSGHVCAQG